MMAHTIYKIIHRLQNNLCLLLAPFEFHASVRYANLTVAWNRKLRFEWRFLELLPREKEMESQNVPPGPNIWLASTFNSNPRYERIKLWLLKVAKK